ncbi:SDR family NAD(P)-dependent oxidoreductase [Changpingibacter yushuensis]|uniref:SDR family NAD(P)-dependent oxidoreductase n=1 Tax=Changpingibacter yushuensis TaxID=2758440 RepID=UPI0015F4CA8D|nr:SDR family oxidoreductase [Changpingibacter yushuensis]
MNTDQQAGIPANRILITGASRGIGAYIAEGLANSSRTLILVARKASHLDPVASACETAGADVCILGCDLSKRESIAQMIKVVLSDGAPDMIVNCAGVSGQEVAPWESDPDQWWQTQLVNLRAPYLIQRWLVPTMLERGGGRILDLSSGAAVTDFETSSDYWTSKTALFRLGSSMHVAGFERGLRVLEMAPGVVQTDMTRHMKMHEGRTQWTDPEDVVAIASAFADGKLDGLSGAFVRAGVDSLGSLIEKSIAGIGGDERRLRVTPWAK